MGLSGQNLLKNYENVVNYEDNYKIQKSNLEEIKKNDLSKFWTDNPKEIRFGFIGKNYQRLHIKFISVIKNTDKPNQYFVYGKSMVSNNICPFQGIIDILESYSIRSAEFPNIETGILVGEYTFFEKPEMPHSGIFRGKFATYWYKNDAGNFEYNDLFGSAAGYNNNQFAGLWSAYESKNSKVANWGDSRIPQSGDLDVGTSEFGVNEKYMSHGWESFIKSMRGGFSDEEEQAAKGKESKKWWKD